MREKKRSEWLIISLLLCHAELSPVWQAWETTNPDPTQTSDEHGTQKSAKYTDREPKIKKNKNKSFIKLPVNIFTISKFSLFFFFSRIQLRYIKAKHSRSSAPSPMTCRSLCFPPGGWLVPLVFLLTNATIPHILLRIDTQWPNHSILSFTMPCLSAFTWNKTVLIEHKNMAAT